MYIFFIFFLLLLSGCKVEVNSSDGNFTSSVDQNLDTDTNNSYDINSSDANNSVDTNTTHNNDSNQTHTDADLLFDASQGAIYDSNACYSGFATAVPLQDYNSNESPRESDDDTNGISIMSLYTQTLDTSESRVIAFYKKIPNGITLSDVTKRENIYGDNSQFVLMFDPIWKSLETNTVYIQTPTLAQSLPKCYRITIKNIATNLITPQQVYRYKN